MAVSVLPAGKRAQLRDIDRRATIAGRHGLVHLLAEEWRWAYYELDAAWQRIAELEQQLRSHDAPRRRRARKVPYGGTAPVAPGSDTSAEAAAKWDYRRITQTHDAILNALLYRGAVRKHTTVLPGGTLNDWEGGATRRELAQILNMSRDTVNARCAELISAELIHQHAEARRGSSGVLELVRLPPRVTE